jgi:hypothetical protein
MAKLQRLLRSRQAASLYCNAMQVASSPQPFDAVIVGSGALGNDRKTSVFNRYCQRHELPNLFCTDGAVTLSMMALTVRTCDYITREYAGKA